MMFKFTETVHEGWEKLINLGIRTQTKVRLAEPGEVSESALLEWLNREAKFDNEIGTWSVQMEGGEWEIESMDDDWEGFVSEVMSSLNTFGVSFPDSPAYDLSR